LCLEPRGGTDEYTLPGRTQPSRAEQTHGAPERRQAFGAQAQARADFADAGASDEEIAISVGVGGSTVYRTKRRFLVGNLEEALSEEPRPGASRKLSGKEEALLVATACSNPPDGRARWTLELLADELVRLTEHDSISRETVRRRLTENDLKPWRKDMWCIPHIDSRATGARDHRLGAAAQCHPGPRQMDVHNRKSPRQNGPRLPRASQHQNAPDERVIILVQRY
jgi:transposase